MRKVALLLVGLLLFPAISSAQESGVTEAVPVANVAVSGGEILGREGNTVRVGFTIGNGDAFVQPGIRYGVEILPLAHDATGPIRTEDVRVADETLTLAPGEVVGREFSADFSESLSGVYRVNVVARTVGGLMLGRSEAGTVRLQGSVEDPIILSACSVRVGSDETRYSRGQVAPVSPNGSMVVDCIADNRGEARAVTPHVETAAFSVYSGITAESDSSGVPVPAGVSRISVPVRASENPRTYAARLTLRDDRTDVSSSGFFTYAVEGDSAVFSNIRFDKTDYAAGETATVAFAILGAGADGASADISILDRNGTLCSDETARTEATFDSVASGAVIGRVGIPVVRDCAGARVSASLTGSVGSVLDSLGGKSASRGALPGMETEADPMKVALIAIVILMTVIGAVSVLVSAFRRKRGGKIIGTMAIVVAGGIGCVALSASAQIFTIPTITVPEDIDDATTVAINSGDSDTSSGDDTLSAFIMASNSCPDGTCGITLIINVDSSLGSQNAGTVTASNIKQEYAPGEDMSDVAWDIEMATPAGATVTSSAKAGIGSATDAFFTCDDCANGTYGGSFSYNAPMSSGNQNFCLSYDYDISMSGLHDYAFAGSCVGFAVGNGTVAPPASVSFSADPIEIVPGESVTLDWTTSDADSCTASSVPSVTSWSGAKSASGGSQMISGLTEDTTFSIVCDGPGGQSSTESRTVYVCPICQNTAPTAPIVDSDSPGMTGLPLSITAWSSDKECDNIRYGFDWDMNGTVDEWVPTGYAYSGAIVTTQHVWNTAGDHTFQVLAEDDWDGAQSGWTQHSISIAVAAPPSVLTLCIQGSDADPYTIAKGDSLMMSAHYGIAGDCFDADVTASADFDDSDTPNDAVSVSGATLSGTEAGSERISVTYDGQSDETLVSVTALCEYDCRADRHCDGEKFSVTDSCGGEHVCTGTRSCDFNWKETVPGE